MGCTVHGRPTDSSVAHKKGQALLWQKAARGLKKESCPGRLGPIARQRAQRAGRSKKFGSSRQDSPTRVQAARGPLRRTLGRDAMDGAEPNRAPRSVSGQVGVLAMLGSVRPGRRESPRCVTEGQPVARHERRTPVAFTRAEKHPLLQSCVSFALGFPIPNSCRRSVK